MSFYKDRMTPSQVRNVAETISADPTVAKIFAQEIIDRLVKLIPRDGLVSAERLEDAFMIAVDVRKIFSLSKLDIWEFFPRYKEPSLLGYVFVSAVDGRSLSEVIQEAQAICGLKKDTDDFLFDATAFSGSYQHRKMYA